MHRATTPLITAYINDRYVLRDSIGAYIPMQNVQALMRELMAEFDNIYCGVMPHKVAGQVFVVRSHKTKKLFAEIRVK